MRKPKKMPPKGRCPVEERVPVGRDSAHYASEAGIPPNASDSAYKRTRPKPNPDLPPDYDPEEEF